MPLPLSFNFVTSIIEVPSPDISLDMQYLIDQIRDTEDNFAPGLNYPKIANATGKDDLGGGVFTGITVTLLDNWQVRFEARPGPAYVQVTISGGNLVGGPGNNPVATSAFTQVIRLASASATIATPSTTSDTTNLKYMIASLLGRHQTVGDIFYWDPVSGNDSHTGLTPDTAVATFAIAQGLAVAGNHDVIFCLSSDPSGITTVTEKLTISKSTLRVTGPGYVFQLIPTSASADTVIITADDVELSGMYVSTYSTGSKNAITITGDNAVIKNCWISNVRGNGVDISSSTRSQISTSAIDTCGLSGTGNGINIGDSTTKLTIEKCIINNNVSGINLSGTGLADNIIENNLIYQNSSYGVDINTGVLRTTIRSGNTFNVNTTADTHNVGTNTYIESQAGGATPSQIATAVWDEVISSHTTAGTVGRTLRDAKTKATLASLKG